MPKRKSRKPTGLHALIGKKVVLDTAGPLTYLGTLREIHGDGFLLSDADIRDRNEGHVSKEEYICEARRSGIQANRKSVFVLAHAVLSASPLNEVVKG